MTATPDQIRDDIERTRAGLSDDVNQLADTVDPRQIAHRQADKVKDAVVGVKDKVMGSESEDGVMTTAARGPRRASGWAREQTSSNPWAAGLIALGVGWMVGSMLPASRAERQAAEGIAEMAKPALGSTVGTAAGEIADHLKEPVGDAVAAVRSTATDAAESVKGAVDEQTGSNSSASSTA